MFVIYTQRRKYLFCLCSLPVKIMQSCELYEQQLKATKGGAFTVAVAGLLPVQSDSPPPPTAQPLLLLLFLIFLTASPLPPATAATQRWRCSGNQLVINP